MEDYSFEIKRKSLPPLLRRRCLLVAKFGGFRQFSAVFLTEFLDQIVVDNPI
jgi:hypothetical protein